MKQALFKWGIAFSIITFLIMYAIFWYEIGHYGLELGIFVMIILLILYAVCIVMAISIHNDRGYYKGKIIATTIISGTPLLTYCIAAIISKPESTNYGVALIALFISNLLLFLIYFVSIFEKEEKK